MKRRLFNLPFGPEMDVGRELHGPLRWLFWTLIVLMPVSVAGCVALDLRPSDAEVWGAAPLEDAERAIVVAGHPYRSHHGGLYITAVDERRATQLERLVPAVLAQQGPPDASLVPLRQLYGPVPPTPCQEARVERQQMLVSHVAAAITAYTALGYAIPLVHGQPRLPYRTTFHRDPHTGGGSAGLMLALAIVNRFGDLTHGYKIAGTGTLTPNGDVGPIGGARFKVLGAQRAGIEYFFVPARWYPYTTWYGHYTSNYDEARVCRCAGAMRLVPVRTLTEALAFLRHLR